MSIPALDASGLLPSGIHDATVDEIARTFGQSASRRALMSCLRQYSSEIRQWRLARELFVNGSFVTANEEPHDIDVILVLPEDYDLRREVSPFEYNLRSHRMVKKTYGLDLFAVRPNSLELERFLRLFSQVRNEPGREKGIVRVQI